MNIYNQEQLRKKIKEIMDTEYERMYPFELEKQLSEIFKMAEENNDEEIKQEVLWEIDLLNRAFGHKGTYHGKEFTEISNKWQYFLETEKFKPFSNPPFCVWKKEAVDYYKRRFEDTRSTLSRARYAFAIMVFSSGQDKLQWMKNSVENWKITAEKYIEDEVYKDKFYEVPSFAYEFALKLSLSFGQKELAKEILESLHKNIINILKSGEQRWYLEFFEVESKHINQFENVEKLKEESVNELKKLIKILDKTFKESQDKHKSNHFMRSHIKILINYGNEDKYYWDKRLAESYIEEAEAREDPLVKSAFYNDAIKKYKSMQSSYPNKSDEIKKRIEEIALKIKEVNSKIKYKQIQSKIKITKDQIEEYITQLKSKNKNLFIAFLDDSSLFPKYKIIREQTKQQKKDFPLQFIMPITVYNKEEPILKIIKEEDIFEYHIRRNILLGLKIGEIMCKITLDTLEKEIDVNNEIKELLKQPELSEIKITLEKGFDFVFGEKTDFIVALHILVPYIEEVIRLILKKAGKVDVILKNHETKFFRGIELGGLLTDKNVEELIGSDFQKSLKIMLVDNDQANLRNELLHGRLSSDKIKESQTKFIAYCLLKLIKILKDIDNSS